MGTTPRTSTPYPDLTDPPNGPDQFLAALGHLEEYGVPRFSDAAARNSTITSPAAGDLAYLTSTNQLTVYDGSTWLVAYSAGVPSWTPNLASVTVGNGTVTGAYTQNGRQVTGFVTCTLGSTSSVGSNPGLTLPVNCHASSVKYVPLGSALFLDTSAGSIYHGVLHMDSSGASTAARFRSSNSSGSRLTEDLMSSTVPFTWATGDVLAASFNYLADDPA